MKINSVSVRTDGRSYSLSCKTDDARFHVWCIERGKPGDTLYKNPPDGVDRRSEEYFPTRHLRADSKASAAMIDEMVSVANRDGLWVLADQEHRDRALAEGVEHVKSGFAHCRKEAGPRLFKALARLAAAYGKLIELHGYDNDAALRSAHVALAEAEPNTEFWNDWRTRYGDRAIELAIAADKETEEAQ